MERRKQQFFSIIFLKTQYVWIIDYNSHQYLQYKKIFPVLKIIFQLYFQEKQILKDIGMADVRLRGV